MMRIVTSIFALLALSNISLSYAANPEGARKCTIWKGFNERLTVEETKALTIPCDCETKGECLSTGCCFFDGYGYYPLQNPGLFTDTSVVGCQKDSNVRDLIIFVTDGGELTNERCGLMIESNHDSSIVQGTQVGQECHGGSHFGSLGPSTDCGMKCKDGSDCGGRWANHVEVFNLIPTTSEYGNGSEDFFCLVWGEGLDTFVFGGSSKETNFGYCSGMKLEFNKTKVDSNDSIILNGRDGAAILTVKGDPDSEYVNCTLPHGETFICGRKPNPKGYKRMMFTFVGCSVYISIDTINQYPEYPGVKLNSGVAHSLINTNGISIWLSNVTACRAVQCANEPNVLPARIPIALGVFPHQATHKIEKGRLFDGSFYNIVGMADRCKAGACRKLLNELKVVVGDLVIQVNETKRIVECTQESKTVTCGRFTTSVGIETLGFGISDCLLHTYINGFRQEGLAIRLVNDFVEEIVVSGPAAIPKIYSSSPGTKPMMCMKQSSLGGTLGCFNTTETTMLVEAEGSNCLQACLGYPFYAQKGDKCYCAHNLDVGVKAECNDSLHSFTAIHNGYMGNGYSPLGCFNTDANLKETEVTSAESMTVEHCANTCDGFKYIGLVGGNTCLCLSDLPANGLSTRCDQQCASSHKQCGGDSTYSVYLMHADRTYTGQDRTLVRNDELCGLDNRVESGPSKGLPSECSVQGGKPFCNLEGECSFYRTSGAHNIRLDYEPTYVTDGTDCVLVADRVGDGCGPGTHAPNGTAFAMCDPLSSWPCCHDGVCSATREGVCEYDDIDFRDLFPHLTYDHDTGGGGSGGGDGEDGDGECEIWYKRVDIVGAFNIPIQVAAATKHECFLACSNRDDCHSYEFNLHVSVCTLKSSQCGKSEYVQDDSGGYADVKCESVTGGLGSSENQRVVLDTRYVRGIKNCGDDKSDVDVDFSSIVEVSA